MLINPERYPRIKHYLNSLYEKINFLVPRLSLKFDLLEEYKWSIVLNYMLLKVLGGNPLSEFLEEKMGDNLYNYKIISVNKLKNKRNRIVRTLPASFNDLYFSFFENYKVNPYVMRQNLQFFRTDLELKILFYLFGGKPIQYNNNLVDITGALYFERKDFKFKSDMAEKKLELLENHLTNDSNGLYYPIAANFESHWVAINSVKGNRISFNDPATGKKRWGKISKRIPASYRFYFFEYDPNSIEFLKSKYKNFINSEIEDELDNVKSFTESLTSGIEQDLLLDQVASKPEQKPISIEEDKEEKQSPQKPKSGSEFMKELKKRVKDSFSDYSDV
ncbi:MAG: hypothetical protein ACOC44_07630 [Promethearchaeia archaeon]